MVAITITAKSGQVDFVTNAVEKGTVIVTAITGTSDQTAETVGAEVDIRIGVRGVESENGGIGTLFIIAIHRRNCAEADRQIYVLRETHEMDI